MRFIRWSQIFHIRKRIILLLSPLLNRGLGENILRKDMSWKTSKGFTLLEMVIVIVILSIVSAITIYFLINSLRIYTMTVNQKTLLDEGKLALERMCRDIRDANDISFPNAGNSANWITFTRTNGTAQDIANESITFQRNVGPRTLVKVKASPSTTSVLAADVSAFTVTRGEQATNNENEITLELTLSLGTGENVTLQTKVYPKNLPDIDTYKTFFTNWKEERSS